MAKRQITKSFWADPQTRQAQMRLGIPLDFKRAQTEAVTTEQAAATVVSQFYYEGRIKQGGAAEALSELPVNEILPRAEDLVYFNFRAISQRLIDCYSVDYTRPGVLEASTPLLVDQRVCKDHRNWKAEDAVGRIVQATWDAQGVNSNNLPGINIRFFVDAKIEPRLVRLLSYGAVRSGSVTVGFEWEPSHPQLLEDGKFWWFLGQEIEGQIVRLIVTKILFYTEFSPVYEGADEDAKRIPDDAMPASDDAGEDENGRKKGMYSASQQEKTTVKLNAEQKKTLGLAADSPDDVAEQQVIETALRELSAARGLVEQASTLIEAERAEVVRLATLAEVGSGEGKLPDVLANVIANAKPADLGGLKALYAEKAQAKLGTGRSSVEPDHGFKPQTPQKQAHAIPFL